MTDNYQISSNFTLFYKMFIPTVWVSFFGVFTLMLFFAPKEGSFLFSNSFRLPFLGIFILFFLLLYFTLLNLKRVEFNPTNWTVTNYLKTFQYNYDDIERISITNLGLITLSRVHLKSKGSFGDKIPIILNKPVLDHFLKDYPDLIKGQIGKK